MSGLFFACLYSYSQGRYRSSNSDPNEPKLNARQVEMIVPIMSQFAKHTQFSLALIDSGDVLFFGLERREIRLFRCQMKTAFLKLGRYPKYLPPIYW